MAPAIKRKREDAEDPVSHKALKVPRHSTSVSKEQTAVPDTKHQHTSDSQINDVNSRETSKDILHTSTGSSFPDAELLNGHHHDSKSQNKDVDNSGIRSESFDISRTKEKTSKTRRNRKQRGVTNKVETNTVDEEDLKGCKDQLISNESGTVLQRTLSVPPPSGPWRLSIANAGKFIDHKPIFVDNDKSIILSVSSALRVYSVSTSVLVNSISLNSPTYESASIIAYAASAVDDQIVYVSTNNSLLFKVDWKTGQHLGQWHGSSDLTSLSTFSHDGYGPPEDILVYIEQSKAGSKIVARSMPKGAERSKFQKKIIHTSKDTIQHLECDPLGIIVAHTEDRLLVGSPSFNGVDFMEVQYAWREAQVAEHIKCVDVRTHKKDVISRSDLQQPSSGLVADVIVGDGKGAVIIYYDFLAVSSQHNGTIQYSRVDGRQIHWHRSIISTARWSADGNYIISGGNERTLVIWQLDTSRPQFLPHLPSSIESVVVSSSGTLYALRLGDNSVIVVKTSDLELKASITGIQADSWAVSDRRVKQPQHNRPISDWSALKSYLLLKLPSIISPTYSSHLLLAVPSIQASSETQKGCPYLQSFDHSSGRSVGRQALTRTNATVKQIGGDLNPISEPTVYLVKSTHDGNWLATVDEWTPPASSSEHSSDHALNLPNSIRREIYLKFWKRDHKAQEWVLVARVDAPHNTWDSNHEPGLVLDMTANPRKAEFATIGEDGIVKIWKPKIRMQDGLVIRAAKTDDEGLWGWSCRRIVPLNQPIDAEEDSHIPSSACLTYSEDASTLAASYQYGGSRDPCLVHFIQTLNGVVKLSRTGLVTGSPLAMGFINRHLIVLSEDITVWDVVDDCLQYGFKLPRSKTSDIYRSASTHLAIDLINNTFAVALPISRAPTNANKSKHSPAQIAVFSPEQPSPQFHVESPYPITALHFNPSTRGYLAVDAAAEIRYITPNVTTIPEVPSAIAVVPDDEKEPDSTSRNVYAGLEFPELSLAENNNNLNRELVERRDFDGDDDKDDDGPSIVRKEQLAEIFDVGSTFSMPPVDKLFAQVASLYIGQPKA